MKKSFLGSISLHALVLVAALFGISEVKPFEIKPVEAIQVDISNSTDATKVKAQTKSEEKPVDKPKPKVSRSVEKAKPQEKVSEQKKVAAKEPAKAEPPPEPEKKVEPKKVEDAPVDPNPLKDLLVAEEAELKLAEEKKKKEEEKKKKDEAKKKKAEEDKKKKEEAEAKAKADAKKKADAEKKKQKLDVAQLEKLLNKENEESEAPVEKKDEAGTPEKAEKDIQGSDEAMSATIIDALNQKLKECWSIPPSVREAQEVVTVQWNLSKSGNVTGQPIVIGGSGGATAQQAALSAVMACAPYDWLPPDGYNLWRELTWDFKPN